MMEPCPSTRGRLDAVGLRHVPLDQPQLLVDDYLIESRHDGHALAATVPHVMHLPERVGEPVIGPDQPWEPRGISQPSVLYDRDAGLFRMYYTCNQREQRGQKGYPPGSYFLAYAESEDGLSWTKPILGHQAWGSAAETNILFQGEREAKIAHAHVDDGTDGVPDGGEIANVGMLPGRFFCGHRFLMYYGDGAHWLATSDDGVHWDQQASLVIANRIDCCQTLVYDEVRQEFVTYNRNKLIFGGPTKSPPELAGNTRMISRMAGRDLWTEWDTMPVAVLIPDAGDAERFYGMPTLRYAGLYIGFLQHFHEHPQTLQVEVVFIRDGIRWERSPGRELWLPVGEAGSWDQGMVITGDRVIERGDEWWVYYSGNDGYHDSEARTSAIGVARMRKEGFVSVRAGAEESYVLTRPFHWPGGELALNARVEEGGSMEVRVTDLRRQTVPGFGYDDGTPFRGDAVRHPVRWGERRLAQLTGQLVRLEFRFAKVDLFGFVARTGN